MKVILEKEGPTLTPWMGAAVFMIGVIITALAIKLSFVIGEAVTESYQMPEPSEWAIPHGTEVYVNGQLTSVVGTDQCNTGFGEGYRCWRFSLRPGDTQTIVYANGHFEDLTTQAHDSRGVSLTNPEGKLLRVAHTEKVLLNDSMDN